MTIETLIKQYEEELLFCDDRIKAHIKEGFYDYAFKHSVRKEVIRGFIINLNKL